MKISIKSKNGNTIHVYSHMVNIFLDNVNSSIRIETNLSIFLNETINDRRLFEDICKSIANNDSIKEIKINLSIEKMLVIYKEVKEPKVKEEKKPTFNFINQLKKENINLKDNSNKSIENIF